MTYTPSWLKTDIKKNEDDYGWNYEGWKDGSSKVDLAPPPLTTPSNPRAFKNMPITSGIEGLDKVTAPSQDNGFWAKIRNLNLENTKAFKTLTSPIDALYKIPLTQRILTTAGNTIGGEGAVQNQDGTPMEKLNAGKVGNLVSDLAGTGLGYSMPMAGLNNSLQGATSKIMQPIENIIPKGTFKLAQYGNNALRQGLEFGALNAAQATAENKDTKDIGLSALEGLGQGAAFGTLTKGVGELIPKIKNSAFPDWKTTFESGNIEPLNPLENPLKQPQKTPSNIIAPNEILKPIQSDKGVIDLKPSIGATDRTKSISQIVSSKEGQQKGNLKDKWENVYTRFIDSNTPIKKVGEDTYIKATNSKNVGGIVDHILTKNLVDRQGNKIGESLKSIVKDIPKDKEDDFFKLCVAKA